METAAVPDKVDRLFADWILAPLYLTMVVHVGLWKIDVVLASIA